MKKDEGAGNHPSCSQSPHGITVVARCAQGKINQPPSLEGASELGAIISVSYNRLPASPLF